MAIITPPGYTPPPADLPQRGDRATFSNRVDDWVMWFSTVILTQLAAMIANAFNNATEAFNWATASAASAATSLARANDAAASAAAAATTANTSVWVSGATIAQYANVISPLDARTYRRKTATGSGTTDPALDGGVNYVLVSMGLYPELVVAHRLASGTNGGTSVSATWNTRPFNVTDVNSIGGASIASNVITLPAGTYKLRGRAPGNNPNGHQLRFRNTTDSTNAVVGGNSTMTGGINTQTDAAIEGQFTIASTKTFSLEHWVNAGATNTGLGAAVSSGAGEVYAQLKIVKVA